MRISFHAAVVATFLAAMICPSASAISLQAASDSNSAAQPKPDSQVPDDIDDDFEDMPSVEDEFTSEEIKNKNQGHGIGNNVGNEPTTNEQVNEIPKKKVKKFHRRDIIDPYTGEPIFGEELQAVKRKYRMD